MLLNKVIDSYVTLHYEIARMKIDAHLSFSKREALGIRLPLMRRNKSFKKQKMTIFLNHIVTTYEKFLEKTSFHDKLHL